MQKQLESRVNLSQWKLPAAKAGKLKVSKSEAADTGGKYWISGTDKRHNSSCRCYQKPEGRLSSKNEGKACKVCGGSSWSFTKIHLEVAGLRGCILWLNSE